ncbi:hypothetical protein T484DRAFT_1894208, partial [Baffinella frigidus]
MGRQRSDGLSGAALWAGAGGEGEGASDLEPAFSQWGGGASGSSDTCDVGKRRAGGGSFKALDLTHSGVITAEDLREVSSAKFADGKNSGVIDLEDFASLCRAPSTPSVSARSSPWAGAATSPLVPPLSPHRGLPPLSPLNLPTRARGASEGVVSPMRGVTEEEG